MSERKTTPGPWELERVSAGGTLRVIAPEASGSPSVALVISVIRHSRLMDERRA